mmetsp:Transcript_25111/g.73507  ORF Transcript_25111/g.73507 Transcript_25111/m.73507 type:complete len:108 (+) Transcript_25111:3-326(+)
MLLMACSLGCALEIPRPYYMLDEDHNGGLRVDQDLPWSRYFNASPGAEWEHVLDSPPDRANPSELHRMPGGDSTFNAANGLRLPTVDDIQHVLAIHPTATIRLEFGR